MIRQVTAKTREATKANKSERMKRFFFVLFFLKGPVERYTLEGKGQYVRYTIIFQTRREGHHLNSYTMGVV